MSPAATSVDASASRRAKREAREKGPLSLRTGRSGLGFAIERAGPVRGGPATQPLGLDRRGFLHVRQPHKAAGASPFRATCLRDTAAFLVVPREGSSSHGERKPVLQPDLKIAGSRAGDSQSSPPRRQSAALNCYSCRFLPVSRRGTEIQPTD